METLPEIKYGWQVIELLIIGVFGVWIKHNDSACKKLVAKSEELERERTEHRKTERDGQIAGLNNRIDKLVAYEFDKKFEKHLEEHKIKDDKLQNIISSLKDDIHTIDKTCEKIFTILEERTRNAAI